jgi:hypothetical protein
MIARILIFLALALPILAAEYTLPAGRTWPFALEANVNVGVPGGIDQYRPGGVNNRPTTLVTGLDTTGTTDCSAAINAAITAAAHDTCVLLPAGTLRINSTINLGIKRITLRGAGQNSTTLMFYGSGFAITMGAGNNWYPTGVTVVGSPVKGATSVQLSTATNVTIPGMIMFEQDTDWDLPVVPVRVPKKVYSQLVWASAIAGTTVTIFPPLLYDLPAGKNPTASPSENHARGVSVGLEDLTMDAQNAAGEAKVVVQRNYGSWIKNVTIKNFSSIGLTLERALLCEFRGMIISADLSGPSKSGIKLESTNSFNLFEDNIIYGIQPSFQIFDNSAGNVIAYNFLSASTFGLFVNHALHPAWNLYEGNFTPNVTQDGYFGGASNDIFLRNWVHGTKTDGTATFMFALKRFARNYNLLGNVLGTDGVRTGLYSFGDPNIGNDDSLSVMSWSSTASTLSTRTSDSVGTITAPTGHGITTGQEFDVAWVTTAGGPTKRVSNIRWGVTAGTVSGVSIPIIGGTGAALPVEASTVYVPTSNTSLIAYHQNWDSAANRVRAVTGTLSRTSDGVGSVTVGSGMGAVIQSHVDATFGALGGIALSWQGTVSGLDYNVGTISGDVVPITAANSGTSLPPDGTTVTIHPGIGGFQGHDIDVIRTMLLKENYLVGAGVPSGEELGSDTLPNSLFRTSKPSFFGSLAWPPVDGAEPASYEVLPAGYRYMNAGSTDYLGPSAPTFSTQPTTQTATVGDNVTLTVAGGGSPSPTLQWRKGGVNISGATSSSLVLSNVQLGDAGSYDCVATNTEGTATSNAAVLTVNAAPSEGGTATIQTLNVGTLNIQ